MNTFKRIALSVIFILFTACGSSAPGLDKLKQMCQKDAGTTIYKTVHADGYYDATTKCHHCWERLIDTPLKFIEFCDLKTKRDSVFYDIPDNGCYRLTKIDRSTGQCYKKIDEHMFSFVVEPFVSFRKKQCIAVKKIENPGSKVGLFKDEDKMISENNFDLYRFEYTIKSLHDNQKYGKLINYSLVVKTVGGAGYGCESSAVVGHEVIVKNTGFYESFISKVIIDNK